MAIDQLPNFNPPPAPGPQAGFPPPGGGPPGGGMPGKAESMVGAPAIGLFVVAVIGIFYLLFSIVMNLLGTGIGAFSAASGDSAGMGSLFSGVVGLVFNVIWLLLSGLVIFGALKMKKLESYSLSMAAAVVAALPCTSPCCVLGLPLGIWAIVVLVNQDVKSAFRG